MNFFGPSGPDCQSTKALIGWWRLTKAAVQENLVDHHHAIQQKAFESYFAETREIDIFSNPAVKVTAGWLETEQSGYRRL